MAHLNQGYYYIIQSILKHHVLASFTHIHVFLGGTTNLLKNKKWSLSFLFSLRHLAKTGLSACSYSWYGYWHSSDSSCTKTFVIILFAHLCTFIFLLFSKVLLLFAIWLSCIYLDFHLFAIWSQFHLIVSRVVSMSQTFNSLAVVWISW